MVRKILGFLVLVLVMAGVLVAYSMTSSVSDTEGALASYKQELKSKTKEIAKPFLEKVGVDVEKVKTDDLNIVKRKLEEASSAVDEASKKIFAVRSDKFA